MVEPKNPFRPTEIEQYVTLDGAIAHWARDGRYPLLVSYLTVVDGNLKVLEAHIAHYQGRDDCPVLLSLLKELYCKGYLNSYQKPIERSE